MGRVIVTTFISVNTIATNWENRGKRKHVSFC